MNELGIEKDVGTYIYIYFLYGHRKDFKAVELYMEEMKKNEVIKDFFSYATLINVYWLNRKRF